jgi:hypothetical protein
MLLFHHQNADQNQDIKIANRYSENDRNKSKFDAGGIKRRLDFGNTCYHSVQDLLSSRLLSKNIKIWI